MAIGQQPPSSIYTPTQQQRMFNNSNKRSGGGQNSGRGVPQQPTMSFGNPGGGQQQAVCPPAVGSIGTTITPTTVMLTMLTPVQRVANQDLCTALTQALPTSRADWSPECTSQSCP